MTLTTLVTGSSASAREAAIGALLDAGCSATLILEGLPDGNDRLAAFAQLAHIRIIRIAPACACCTGNLTMRVTLNRVLRHPPDRLYLSLASASHFDKIREFLMQPPYDAYLELTENLHV
jgi:hypothetical protein